MNTGAIIILVAVLLFCIYEVVSLSISLAKKKKKKKASADVVSLVEDSTDDKNNIGGVHDDRNGNNASGD